MWMTESSSGDIGREKCSYKKISVCNNEAVSALVNKTQVRKIGSEKADIYDSLRVTESTKKMEETEISGAPEASEALESSETLESSGSPEAEKVTGDEFPVIPTRL